MGPSTMDQNHYSEWMLTWIARVRRAPPIPVPVSGQLIYDPAYVCSFFFFFLHLNAQGLKRDASEDKFWEEASDDHGNMPLKNKQKIFV